jgi:hypothetical protein
MKGHQLRIALSATSGTFVWNVPKKGTCPTTPATTIAPRTNADNPDGASQRFGCSVAMSSNGARVLTGADYYKTPDEDSPGDFFYGGVLISAI